MQYLGLYFKNVILFVATKLNLTLPRRKSMCIYLISDILNFNKKLFEIYAAPLLLLISIMLQISLNIYFCYNFAMILL